MPKSMTGLMILVTSSLLVFSLGAQERDDSRLKPAERNRAGTLRQLIPGYYVFSSTSFNSGVIATSEGVVVLDALSSEAIARQEREAIASVIKQPVRFLVSSTFHNNYTWGNVAYQDVIKVGHENYRADLLAQMQRDRVSPENQKARLPQVTYRDRLTIHLGGKEIQILYLGRGHTRGDSIIFVPQDRIAYVSELFFSDQFLYMNDGYGVSWLTTLDAIQALPADILVPGDGPIPQIQRRQRRASSVSTDFGGSAQRRAGRNRARGDGRPSCRRDQTAPVRKVARIRIAKGSRCMADVQRNDRQAAMRYRASRTLSF